jgi:hypothetical protein
MVMEKHKGYRILVEDIVGITMGDGIGIEVGNE